MNRTLVFRIGMPLAGALVIGLMALGGWSPAHAAQLPAATSIDQAAARGQHLFDHDTFGGTRTCDACHTAGGTGALSLVGAAARFPKYNPKAHRVITLEQQITRCIQHSDGGKAPSADSTQMADLTAYLVKLSKGWTMGRQFRPGR